MTRYTNFKWALTGELQDMEVQDGYVRSRHGHDPSISIAPSKVIDLAGQYVLPSFVDAHCHILPTGLNLSKLLFFSAPNLDNQPNFQHTLQETYDQ